MPKKAKKTTAKPAKKTAAKKTASKATAAAKKPVSRKPAAARTRASAATPTRVVTRRIGGKSEVIGLVGSVTNEEIALKAYYLGERRRHLGLPGDAQSDWLQAERELRG
ncbi:MAG: DUF2934 domain-containing protein [Chthoniobacterales bacterium]|jgi:hypothetical protein